MISMTPGRRSSKYDQALYTLFEGKVPKNIPSLFEKIARCLAEPKILPLEIEGIITDEALSNSRICLARVQIESELRMREDVEYFTQRLWVAQTIERMVFGGLMVEGEKLEDSDDENDDD
jgi:hypothetical protein